MHILKNVNSKHKSRERGTKLVYLVGLPNWNIADSLSGWWTCVHCSCSFKKKYLHLKTLTTLSLVSIQEWRNREGFDCYNPSIFRQGVQQHNYTQPVFRCTSKQNNSWKTEKQPNEITKISNIHTCTWIDHPNLLSKSELAWKNSHACTKSHIFK